MLKMIFAAAAFAVGVTGIGNAAFEAATVRRAPAYPLVVHDPYFSIWSTTDELHKSWPVHWTGRTNALCSIVQIDGKPFRLMGLQPTTAPGMKQVSVQVLPTSTIYTFAEAGVQVTLTFTSPVVPHDADLASRPITYLTWSARSTDGQPHQLAIYFDATAESAVNETSQEVAWFTSSTDTLKTIGIGTTEQPVLKKDGDDLRIDWGHLIASAPAAGLARAEPSAVEKSRDEFALTGTFAAPAGPMPRPAKTDWPGLAFAWKAEAVSTQPLTRHLMLGYDDGYSVEYLGQKLKPWWAREGKPFSTLLTEAETNYDKNLKLSRDFDTSMLTDLEKIGSADLAWIGSLSYRQALGAHKIVAGPGNKMMMFSKENFSNGCMGTVDVIYPASPIFLTFSPEMLKANLRPILDYSQSDRWRFPFAPHDLGRYPKANGQVYGGGEKTEENQMPVEESGNMLIQLAALAHIEGNADFSKPYMPTLKKWAEYLRKKGLDPENQLCTDDFAGHLAHNANLSIKAIMGLGSYGLLCDKLGQADEAKTYRDLARAMAAEWMRKADDGDHYRLAFDKPGTWSQKYNLVWDQLLGFNFFPPEVAKREVAYYKTVTNKYGLPLDNRKDYTKLDWQVWTACLAYGTPDFTTFIQPLAKFTDATEPRVPLTDWYETKDAKMVGFRARSVVGGVFLPLMFDRATWEKWAGGGGK